ncbi:MAG: hypothetical protein HYU66_15535 [Armatimonadetes bacterium]|nr:hypothetical protein [Armatimonadota bacterium]
MLIGLWLCLVVAGFSVLAIWLYPLAEAAFKAVEKRRHRAADAEEMAGAPDLAPAPNAAPARPRPQPPDMPPLGGRVLAALVAFGYPVIVLLNTSLIAYSLLAFLPPGLPLFVLVIGSYRRPVTLNDVLAACLVFALCVGAGLMGVGETARPTRNRAGARPKAPAPPKRDRLQRVWDTTLGRLSPLGRAGFYLALVVTVLQAVVAGARGCLLGGWPNALFSAACAAALALLDATVGFLVLHYGLLPLFEWGAWKLRDRTYRDHQRLYLEEVATASAATRAVTVRPHVTLWERRLILLYRFPLRPLRQLDDWVRRQWWALRGMEPPADPAAHRDGVPRGDRAQLVALDNLDPRNGKDVPWVSLPGPRSRH